MAFPFSSSSSLNGKQKVWVVTVKSAKPKRKQKRKIYVYVHDQPKGRLRDKMNNNTTGSNTTCQGADIVNSEIRKARKGFADSLIRTAVRGVKSLFGCHGTGKKGKVENKESEPKSVVFYDRDFMMVKRNKVLDRYPS